MTLRQMFNPTPHRSSPGKPRFGDSVKIIRASGDGTSKEPVGGPLSSGVRFDFSQAPIYPNPARSAASRGAPLSNPLRRRFEDALGADLGVVRLHTDANAAQAACAIGAAAFTYGSDISFAAGKFNSSTGAGGYLLAHELTHALQQQGAAQTACCLPAVSRPGDRYEAEADRVAENVMTGKRAQVFERSGMRQVMGTFLEMERARALSADFAREALNQDEMIDEIRRTVQERLESPPPASFFRREGDEPWVGEAVEHLTGLPYSASARHPGATGGQLAASGQCNELGGAIQSIRGLAGYAPAGTLPSHYSFYMRHGGIHRRDRDIEETNAGAGLQAGATIFHLEEDATDSQLNHQMPAGSGMGPHWRIKHENTVLRVSIGTQSEPVIGEAESDADPATEESAGRFKWIQIFDTPRLGEGSTWPGYVRGTGDLLGERNPNGYPGTLAQESGWDLASAQLRRGERHWGWAEAGPPEEAPAPVTAHGEEQTTESESSASGHWFMRGRAMLRTRLRGEAAWSAPIEIGLTGGLLHPFTWYIHALSGLPYAETIEVMVELWDAQSTRGRLLNIITLSDGRAQPVGTAEHPRYLTRQAEAVRVLGVSAIPEAPASTP